MVDIDLNEFTEFGKVKDIWNDSLHEKTGLTEFLNNIVMNMNMFDNSNNNGYGIMLQDLSDIYVLVSKQDFPFNKLKTTHNHSIDLSKANKNLVLGYIWLCPWKLENKGCVPYHFIKFIDSRLSGLNIAKYMITNYEGNGKERYLLPYDIGFGARKYWKKYFIETYDINNKNELEQMINKCNLKPSDITWDNLLAIF